MTHRRLLFVLVLSVLLRPGTPAAAESPWPEFRGPNGNGIADVQSAPKTIDESTEIWRTEIAGKGWSSPVIADGLVWITTAIEVPPDPSEVDARLAKAGIPEKQRKSRSIAASIRLRLIAVSVDDGTVVHDRLLREYDQPDAIHSLNSYASPTPVIDGDFIYCAFGTYGTFCIERSTAEIVWQKETTVAHAVGPGSSPIIDGDQLILIHDGLDQQRVVALNKADGSEVWQTSRPPMDEPDGDQRKAYCTPVRITDSGGRDQLICLASQWMVSLNPKNGEELWRCEHGRGFSIVPRPVYDDDTVYFATGFGNTKFWAVDVTGNGNVSDTHVRWQLASGAPQKPSPLLHDGLIYLVTDSGVATCIDVENGKPVWKKRLGGNFSASPLLIGDNLYFCSHEGEIIVLPTGRKTNVLAEHQLGDRIMASPAATEDGLFVRTESSLRLYR